MKEVLRQRALELGFDDCRVTTANAPESAERFKQWLAEGRHGEMAWIERTAPKRVDPQQVLPGARSIIALAVSYHDLNCSPAPAAGDGGPGLPDTRRLGEPADIPSPALKGTLSPSDGWREEVGRLTSIPRPKPIQPAASGGVNPQTATLPPGQAATQTEVGNRQSLITNGQYGLIARYARYGDYHQILSERLKQLTAFVNGLGGADTRSSWYVDTGPLLERDFAQRSGLGFIGKHTNLISRGLGNWVLLAEIITTLELEPDPPEKNRCGSCTRCITACPTAAITAPFQLDARRCISYLTIELRGSIPLELRGAIGDRIFGCDDCLLACPWNRFAREGQLMKAHARPDLGQPDLLELLALDEAGFRQCFAGTPMLRARRRGLLRNVCVALGNIGDERALPALESAAHDLESLIAEHARWAIARIEARHRT